MVPAAVIWSISSVPFEVGRKGGSGRERLRCVVCSGSGAGRRVGGGAVAGAGEKRGGGNYTAAIRGMSEATNRFNARVEATGNRVDELFRRRLDWICQGCGSGGKRRCGPPFGFGHIVRLPNTQLSCGCVPGGGPLAGRFGTGAFPRRCGAGFERMPCS